MENYIKNNLRDIKEIQQYTKDMLEKEFIVNALRRNNGNVLRSALELGLARQTLHKKLKKHGISSRDFKE
ncbi:MAG: helix-turn-helix domain-containing protein [bacterium]